MSIFEVLKLLKFYDYVDNQVIKLKLDSEDDYAYAIEVQETDDSFDLWNKFNSIKQQTKYLPVLYNIWASRVTDNNWKDIVMHDQTFSRFPYSQEITKESFGTSPRAIISQSRKSDYMDIIRRHDENYSMFLLDNLENEFYSYIPKSDSEKMIKKSREMITNGENNTYIEFNKWLLDIEESNGGKSLIDDSYINWYNPDENQLLILLPIENNYDILAYIHFFGAESFSSDAAISMMKYWNKKYGAEIIGHYGTMLNIRIESPPLNINEALDLAIQQEAFAECTTVLSGINIRDHARLLLNKKEWFLHQRP